MRKSYTYLVLLIMVSSCSIQKQIGKEARQDIFSSTDFIPAHVGISIYDPSTQQYLYNYQADKFFVPASNTKLLTCYVAMKNLGDSLVAFRYIDKGNGSIELEANGDASFLHTDFKNQSVFGFLQNQKKISLTDANWKDNALGMGWAWDDYNSDYMVERSVMPIYGNLGKFRQVGQFKPTNDLPSRLLSDTLKTKVEWVHTKIGNGADVIKIHSQPTDSLLKIMMHRSDNFFAEQTLLMVSNEKLGMMNDGRIIDTLLKTDLAGLPQKPKWVDGSGLSRYNFVTPQDFVWVLTQMKNEFKWERIQAILPTGNEGTLGGLYKNYAGRIYAKTGTLSNHIALSGYLLTKKGKTLIFSVLVNAHLTSAANIRKGVEKFLTAIIDRY